MLYNKNQFRKTNDKKVLHKIGKHWVTVSVAFLSLLGLGAVSTTATTHADTTDNANAQTTSAAPNSNSADSIQKQVTKQANALHNQLLGHAAVSQKPAQQGTARLGSVNGRVNQAQTHNVQQNKKPAVNNQMSANHSNTMRLGASPQTNDATDTFIYAKDGKPVGSKSFTGKRSNSDSDALTFISDVTNSDKFPGLKAPSDWVDPSNQQVKKLVHNLSDKVNSGKDHYGDFGTNNVFPVELKHGTINIKFIMSTKKPNKHSIRIGTKHHYNYYKVVHNQLKDGLMQMSNLPYGNYLNSIKLQNELLDSNNKKSYYKNALPSDYSLVPPQYRDGVMELIFINKHHTLTPIVNMDASDITLFKKNGSVVNLYVLAKPLKSSDSLDFIFDNNRNNKLSQSIDIPKGTDISDMNTTNISNAIKAIKNDVKGTKASYSSDINNLRKSNLLTDTETIAQSDLPTLLTQVNNVNLSKLENVHITVPVKSAYAPITIHYIDQNGQPIMSDETISDKNLSDGFDIGSTYSVSDNHHYDTLYGAPTSSNGYAFDKSSIVKGADVKKFTNTPQDITVQFNFDNYNKRHNNAPKGEGNLDVFYYYGNQLQQYKNYGNFPVGTQLDADAFTKQGFHYVNHTSDIKSIKQGTQTIILRNDSNSQLNLPLQKDIIQPNAQDVFTYKDAQGHIIRWVSPKGYTNKPDKEAYKAYIQDSYPNLPEQYKISSNSINAFNNFMNSKPNHNYGTNSFTFTVEPNQRSLVVRFVNAQNPNQFIAPSDTLGNELAGDPVTLPTITKSNAENGFDLKSGHIVQVNGQNADKFSIMPDNDNTVVAIGYNPTNITDKYQDTIKLISSDGTVKTISDKGNNSDNWNNFVNTLSDDEKDGKPYTITTDNKQYMIPLNQNSDMNSDISTVSDAISDMKKQENIATNPFKDSGNNTATQYKNVKLNVQPLGAINVQFVDTSNGQHKVIKLNPKVANSDTSLKVVRSNSGPNTTITDTGYRNTTQDISSDTYTLPSMVSKYLPKGYELAKADNIYQIPSTLRDNIINNNDQNFIEFNGDDANSAINFTSIPQNIQIAIKPIPKPQDATITVHFLDGDKDKTEIPGTTLITAHGQVGSQFDLIAYEDTMLPESNGHVNYSFDDAINNSKNANSYEFVSNHNNNHQDIDLIYSEIKGRIYINYIDRTMGNTVHTTTDTGLVGSPFNNDKSYLENIPSNYYFDGVSDNGVTNYSSVDQNINVYMKPVTPATADRTTITVDYVDKQSGKVVYNAGTTSDSAGAPFDITPYVKNVPSDYHAVGFKNYTQNYGDSNTTVDVLVAKNAPKPASSASSSASGSASKGSSASSASSTNSNSSSSASSASDNQPQINGDIYLNYRDVDSGTIIKSEHFTEPVGTTFALDSYVRNVPSGYELEGLDHVKGATNGFYYGPQTIDIYVTKLSNIPQQNQGIINVSYVDTQTGKPLASDVVIKRNTNSAFNYNNNMKSFSDYTFDKNASTNLNVNKFNNGTQYITLAYDKNKCQITVEFVDRDTGKVLKSVPTTANANTPFNASDYKNDVPAGYEIKGSNSIVNMYDQQPQTYVFNVAKPSIHTITVNYIDKATGKTILTKSDTEDADTPFDIDNYISYIPRGYNWTQMPNDTVSKFDNDNHTYNIYLSKIAPAKPSSASAKPSSASVAPSSKASSASSSSSASSAPSSASSTMPSSSSAAPSSSASVPFIPIMPSSVPSSVTSSSTSSVASRSTMPASKSAAPVTLTNKDYPITISHRASKPDMVTYMGRKYPVHYHANGKNTIRVRERTTKHGKHSYRNVVISTNLPIAKVSSDNLVRAIDHVDFNKVNKHVLSARGLNKALSSAKPGEVISYHGTRLAVVNDPIHWRYFMVDKNTLAHILVTSVGRDDTRNILNARHEYTIFIKHIVAVHGRKTNYIRYEFSYHHHNFWVTARDDFVPNSYWQKSDFRARHAHYVRVIRPCRLYKSTKYNRLTFIRNVRRDTIARVAKVAYINRPSYEQTRLVLDNGRYITANKNFVRIVK